MDYKKALQSLRNLAQNEGKTVMQFLKELTAYVAKTNVASKRARVTLEFVEIDNNGARWDLIVENLQGRNWTSIYFKAMDLDPDQDGMAKLIGYDRAGVLKDRPSMFLFMNVKRKIMGAFTSADKGVYLDGVIASLWFDPAQDYDDIRILNFRLSGHNETRDGKAVRRDIRFDSDGSVVMDPVSLKLSLPEDDE